jgi:holo-[acyl-carrier protein] synthase
VIVGLGMDVVEIARVRAMIERHGARARERLFTAAEIAYAEQRADPARHYAVRFAAKEAAFKALSRSPLARRIGWHELEVVNEADGRPVLRLHGLAATCAGELRACGVWLTLTHSDVVAAATVVVEAEPGPAGTVAAAPAP